ncbi:MFS transporter [Agrococcus sp. ARC_14]|uniref:MFS transporter n=1 Tax=Agrococcus sp. ARC_14 TaxID=2919927 RepID=UPI001F05D8EF|nr:MFS transporter [Agrococcus sp. ARC_14]MCH1881355.1 MFS transporter [Agrococcus sp. ARC_14]
MTTVTDASESASTQVKKLSPLLIGVGFAVLCASWMLNAMDRQVFYPLLPQIREELGLTLVESGFLATSFTLGLAIAGFLAGFLVDRFSRKSIVLGSVIVFSVGTGLVAVSQGFWDMAAYRLLSGIGEGVQATALYAIIGAFFFHRRAFAAGFVGVAFGAGIFLGPLIGVPFATDLGTWRAPFILFALLGVVMALLISIFVKRDMSEAAAGRGGIEAADAFDFVPAALLNRNTVVLGFGAALAGVVFYGYLGLYPTYLTESLGFDPGQSSVAVAMGGLGAMLALLFGYLGDRFPQKWVLLVSFAGTALVAWPMYTTATEPVTQYVLSFLIGAFASGGLFTNISTALQRSVRPERVGRGQGIFVLTYYVAAAFSGTIFGALVGGLGWSGAGLVQVVGVSIVGALLMLLVRTDQMIRRIKA